MTVIGKQVPMKNINIFFLNTSKFSHCSVTIILAHLLFHHGTL